MKVAIIPARGGSKRIPRKNIRSFHGKPMILWPIEIAKKSNIFNRVIVSTDDEEIAEIAQEFGAEVPFMRPAALSGDEISPNNSVAHAIQYLVEQGINIEAACCIYPTNPFLDIEYLQLGLNKLLNDDWDYVFSAAKYSTSIYRSFKLDVNDGVKMFFPQFYASRSQDLDAVYHDAALFYWGRTRSWLEERKIFSDKSSFVEIPNWRVQDIDTYDDWSRAEILFDLMKSKGI